MKKKKKSLNKKESSVKNETKSRRDFLKTAWKGLGILAGIEFTGLTFFYLYDRKIESDEKKIFKIGSPDEFPLNSVTAFRQGHFYLVRLNDGGFIALSLKCSHLGCSIIWVDETKQFICPCHSSKFDVTGKVISPPAPRALNYFPVFIKDGVLQIDLNDSNKRDDFQKSQLTYL